LERLPKKGTILAYFYCYGDKKLNVGKKRKIFIMKYIYKEFIWKSKIVLAKRGCKKYDRVELKNNNRNREMSR